MGIVGVSAAPLAGLLVAAHRVRRYSHSGRCGEIPFATGGFTGTGGKYEPAKGIVHRGEGFTMALHEGGSQPDWRESLHRLMRVCHRRLRRYTGTWRTAGRRRPGRLKQNNHVVINSDGTNGRMELKLL